jgi:Cys-rich repeat protein
MTLLLLVACTGPEVECSDELPCGFGEVCDEGFCKQVPCATSAQCGMEEFCQDRNCVAGCAEDTDCYPGSSCDVQAHECVPAECRDTRRDCGFQQFCNEANGQCYDAGGDYCRHCSSDDDCAEGNYCLNFGGGKSYCGVECTTDHDCPAGFDCIPLGDFNGNITTYQCLTYCWLYEDAGDGPAQRVAPGAPRVDPLDVAPVCAVGP